MESNNENSGCDTQSVNHDTSNDTQSVTYEGTSKDTQSVHPQMHMMQKNMSAMLSIVQEMGAAWSSLATKRQRCDSDSDSDSPAQKSHRSHDLDDLHDLFSNAANSGDEDDNWGLLDDIEDIKNDDEKGPCVKDKLAQKVNDRFMGNIGSEKIAAKQKAYLCPENCPALAVPRCNEEIWRKLEKHHKQADIRVAGIQRAIAAGATGLVQMLEALLSSGKATGSLDVQGLVTKGCDSLALLGYANQELSQKRREAMRPALKKEYVGLLSRSVPVTSKLFGDDLMKTMRDLKQEATLTKEASASWGSKNYRRRGFQPPRGSWRPKKNWDHKGRSNQAANQTGEKMKKRY